MENALRFVVLMSTILSCMVTDDSVITSHKPDSYNKSIWHEESSADFSLLPVPDIKSLYCRRTAHCRQLNSTLCMGAKLPYTFTTTDLVHDLSAQQNVQELLQQWQRFRHIPKCWAVIQPFLCSLYMPKCENGTVDLPSQEMCKMTLGPCRIIEPAKNWPLIFKCDDRLKYPPMCKNDIKELKFNITGQCMHPLVQTDNTQAFYEGVEGCGLKCENPLLTRDEHQQIHLLVLWTGTFCFLCNLFTVVTFLIDWRSANKYPALIIFYISMCFVISCIGWLVQFIPGAREGIVCRKDGTLRFSEPSAGENLSCVIIFVLVYYFIMAALVWFVIFTYTWHISFRCMGKIHERIDKKGAYFHMIAWSFPLILTITTMALGEIDGDSIAGICFVGYENMAARAAFLLGPLTLVLLVGGFFLFKGLFTLIKLKISSQEIVSEQVSAKIRETIIRMGIFSLLILTFAVVTFICHIYNFQRRNDWNDSLKEYIICQILNADATNPEKCTIHSRPSVAMLQLQILVMFLAGVVVSSWVWTSSTLDTWKRCFRRTFNSEPEQPVRIKKHKAIAQAFAKRKTFNSAGRLSISIHSTHDDPVGLNLDLSSIVSQDFSSTWAAALPKLMTRRGALIAPATASGSSQRRNSVDSEISYSVRRVSVESQRHSLDSQVSVQIAEVTATRKAISTPVPTTHMCGRTRQPRMKRRKKDFGRMLRSSRVGPLFARRESTTSQESQLGVQMLSTLTFGHHNVPPCVPNLMKRRTATVGLDNSKIILPFSLPGQSMDQGEDESTKKEKNTLDDVLNSTDSKETKCPSKTRAVTDVTNNTVPDCETNYSETSLQKNIKELPENNERKKDSIQDSLINNVFVKEKKENDESAQHPIKISTPTRQSNSVLETDSVRDTCGYRNKNVPDDLKLYLSEESDIDYHIKFDKFPQLDVKSIPNDSVSVNPELSQPLASKMEANTCSFRNVSVGTCDNDRTVEVTQCKRSIGTQTSQNSYNGCEAKEYSISPKTLRSSGISVKSLSASPQKFQVQSVRHAKSPAVNKLVGEISNPSYRGQYYSYNSHQEYAERSDTVLKSKSDRKTKKSVKNNCTNSMDEKSNHYSNTVPV